ncbi:hypothetical protein BgiMline_018946, partial [Biomphalaria glabrata]
IFLQLNAHTAVMEESRHISSRKFVKLEQKRKSHYIKNPPYSNNSLSAMDLTTQQMLRAYYTGKTAIVQNPKKRSSNFNKALSAEQSACHSSDFNKALSAEQSACSGDYFPLYINQLIKEVLEELRSSMDTLVSKKDRITSEKAWLDNKVRALSKLVVQISRQSKKTLWCEQNKPVWWDENVGLGWKNPTANPKDTKKDLEKKYLALEQYLLSKGLFPEEIEKEADLWKAGKKFELFQYIELTSLITEVEKIKTSTAHIFENMSLTEIESLSIQHIVEKLKTYLTAIENSKARESIGVKRHYSNDDDLNDNSFPTKMRKSDSPPKNNLKLKVVESTPNVFSSKISLQDEKKCHSFQPNISLDCPVTRLPSKETPEDCIFCCSLNTHNLDLGLPNTMTTNDVNMTPTFHDGSDIQTLNETEHFLESFFSEPLNSITESSHLDTDLCLSSSQKEFFPNPISSPNVNPSKDENCGFVNPQKIDLASINQSASSSFDSSLYICPELNDWVANDLSTDNAFSPRCFLNSTIAELTYLTEISSPKDVKPCSLSSDSTINDHDPNVENNLSSPFDVTNFELIDWLINETISGQPNQTSSITIDDSGDGACFDNIAMNS